MPTTEWLNKYESIKEKLTCKTDLDAHFTEKVIGNMGVDVLDIGAVHFPTGTIFACDPLVELEDTPPFIQTIPAGTYPVKICVVPSEKYGDRYACVKVEVSREKPVRYELGMTGKEDLDEGLDEDDYFGFGVDAGMGCVADIQTQACMCASSTLKPATRSRRKEGNSDGMAETGADSELGERCPDLRRRKAI